MDLPKIDSRTKEDLLRYIKKYLSHYTPEWRFDEKNPDVGTALAYIYADMMSETIYRLNQTADKNRVMFFNQIGTDLLPAIPASGYATFSLVNDEVDGVEVRKGEAVLAQTPEGENMVFETRQDLYVTPVKPDCLYLCSRETDRISSLAETEGNHAEPGCLLFDLQGVNLTSRLTASRKPSGSHGRRFRGLKGQVRMSAAIVWIRSKEL